MKILIFITRYLCYASNNVFAVRLSSELRKLGAKVEVCNIMDEADAGACVARYIGQTFDAVIDFNSTLPRAMAGETRFLDEIDAPFYDYIVDHPLYHHPILKLPLHNFNVICLDPSHKKYIETYYPHIKNILVLPLAGTKALTEADFGRREKALLFTGTYYDPEKYRLLIEEKDERLCREYKTMAEILVEKPDLTPEEAFLEMGTALGHDKGKLPAETFREEMNGAFLAEIYARAIIRDRVVSQLLGGGVPMLICGNEWEHFKAPTGSRVKWLKGVDYAQSLELMASVQMLLNVLPGFRYCAHDRVYSMMLNHGLILTDTNPYLESEFENGRECLLFSRNACADFIPQLSELMHEEQGKREMADAGWEKAKRLHAWSNRAQALVSFLEKGKP